jgi:protein-tyrosine phosphatase
MAPEHPQGITKFIKRINGEYSLQRGPILVHCSAGVGRTGTFVALDSLTQQLDEEGQVTIFNTVCDMRYQRNFLVQSLVSSSGTIQCRNRYFNLVISLQKQYIFLYKSLTDIALYGDTEIEQKSLSATVESLKQKTNESDKCKLELQFDVS